jgi:DNA polymerase elongation subunit (family B)
VWADGSGIATIWRRIPETGALVVEHEPFRHWLVLDSLDYLQHLGPRFAPEGTIGSAVNYRELKGNGTLRFLVTADNAARLSSEVLKGASELLGRRIGHLREMGADKVLLLPAEEQYLVASGRTYFRDLTFDDLLRMQFDLETTGLEPHRDRIFLIAIRDSSGVVEVLEADGLNDEAEADLINRLVRKVQASDPDVIENHNLHGFDLPFLDQRARLLGVPLPLGRIDSDGLRKRAARRGTVSLTDSRRRFRFVAPGREFIDTLDAVLRFDFAARELPGHGLKAVARHLGIAKPNREQIRGDQIYDVYRRDPDRVRRYATADVEEVAGLARMLGGAAFALAQMAPRRYERLSDAGAATGIIDPLLVRAYLRAGQALPAHRPGDGTQHSGAALYLFATGVAHRVVKADVASLYPSLMRAYRIGPARDELGALLALVDGLVERRLQAKDKARAEKAGSAERHGHEAMSAALKLVVNSAYGYLAAGGGLTRFADVHSANEVTRRGREVLGLMCRELSARGVTLLEADTDGVYFAVPEAWSEADERRVVAEVAALLPPLVHLEFEGRYAAMLSHEPKNYVLLGYEGTLLLKGVAFRSSRAEPFGETFLRRTLGRVLVGDVAGVRAIYLETIGALRRREVSTFDVSSRVRLTKTPERYLESRKQRRELPYEALLASGRESWIVGERIRVYRTQVGEGGIVGDTDDGVEPSSDGDRRDYDVEFYVRVLRDIYAARLARAFSPDDFGVVFSNPEQPSLFAPSLDSILPVLRVTPTATGILTSWE